MKKHKQGFTLIETLIAIFLLTLTIGGLMTLAADGYFSVRYAKNQIIADNLLQEGLEYIRNDRDTTVQQQGGDWATWVAKYSVCTNSSGCMVDPYTLNSGAHVVACNNQPGSVCLPFTFYPAAGFYGYASTSYPAIFSASSSTSVPYITAYTRTVTMQNTSDPNQVIFNITISWYNGKADQKESQSILLTNWNITS